jgi:tol-pal system protein YbgF
MLKRNALILVIGLWSVAASAQVPVVEAGSRRGQPAAAQPQAENNDLVLQLYTQLEALQGEIQTLRGMVEEQSNQIRRLQSDSRDRYLDVDRRLSELTGGGIAAGTMLAPPPGGVPGAAGGVSLPPTAPGAAPEAPIGDLQGANPAPAVSFGNTQPAAVAPPTVAAPSVTQPATGVPAATGGAAAVTQAPAPQGIDANLGEQDLYRNALNILLEQQPARYEESIAMFQSYIQRFPQGRLLTNAYYWLGEALILVERYEEARDTFTVLVNSYPDDPKAAGAMLKRGDVYQRLGQTDLAQADWRNISVRYPENATEIREADTRLRRQ